MTTNSGLFSIAVLRRGHVDCPHHGLIIIVSKECPMVICPVAIAIGCKKCPIFKVCPAKSIIGDQKSVEDDKKSTLQLRAKKLGKG